MKGAIFLVFAFLAVQASSVPSGFLAESLQAGETFSEAIRLVTGLESHKSESGVLALIKYVVVPSKAKGFIETIRVAKDDAEEFKGLRAYTLVKTADDNLTYWSFASWASGEDLKDYLESDAAKKVEKFLLKEDIPAFITPLLPPLV